MSSSRRPLLAALLAAPAIAPGLARAQAPTSNPAEPERRHWAIAQTGHEHLRWPARCFWLGTAGKR